MKFEFASPTRIVFGSGVSREAVAMAKELGRRVLILSGKKPERAAWLVDALQNSGLFTRIFPVEQEPSTDLVQEVARLARRDRCELVIGLGGGSVVDTGKIIAALVTNQGDLFDYLEVVGSGAPLSEKPIPFIAIPTTAGTGTEATKNSVLCSLQHRVKVSVRSSLLLPTAALIDPELTYSLPPQITASTGLDALTQLIEAFVTRRANPLTDALCREGIRRAGRSLATVFRDGTNAAAREDMCLASLFSGLALANAGLGAVHGIAGPLGGMIGAAHGSICACLLPHVMEVNVVLLSTQTEGAKILHRFDEVAQLLVGRPDACAADAVRVIKELCADLQVPNLMALGFQQEHTAELVEKSLNASSMKGNPVALSGESIREIISKAAQQPAGTVPAGCC